MRDKILNVAIGVLGIVLVLLIVFFVMNIDKTVIPPPVEPSDESGWDPNSNELYVTDEHSEFAAYYESIGANDELVELNENIISAEMSGDVWSVWLGDEEYRLTFDDSTFVAEGNGTTTTGEWKKEYRSDAPQVIYLTLTSEYVNIEGFVGYNGEDVYVYSDVEDITLTPPVHEYYCLRRDTDG